MEHLIADSGIQFIIREVEFNPEEPLIMANGKNLRYTFCEVVNNLGNNNQILFDILISDGNGGFVCPEEVRCSCSNGGLRMNSSGRESLDMSGMPLVDSGFPTNLYTTFQTNTNGVYSINSLNSYRVRSLNESDLIPAFDRLLDTWLPMPIFEVEIDGYTSDLPTGWARVKIQKIGVGKQEGTSRYRFIWAFDTRLSSNPLSILSPCFYPQDGESKDYAICNRTELLLNFLFDKTEDGGSKESANAEYIAAILGVQGGGLQNSYKYIAYYIYLINYIRLLNAAPEITLHNREDKAIPVDFVLDIGNSRTCGVLFENGDFTKAQMLQLRDLSDPSKIYSEPFDMRVVFRKADLGETLILKDNDEKVDLFAWKSIVRVGEEAKKLVYRSLEEEGLAGKTTNYSSPKRYLWDMKPFAGQWEYLITKDDSLALQIHESISMTGITDHFDGAGNYTPNNQNFLFGHNASHFSRSSLMTFVFIEILQHVMSQINSIDFRTKHDDIDCRRYLRNLIITCPTAMTVKEQIRLRQCAQEAFDVLAKLNPVLRQITIIPSPQANNVGWIYDEATSCQLVYLYAEMAKRYGGDVTKFIEMKGHARAEDNINGTIRKSLTIGSIDIGAGTTDLMICKYIHDDNGNCIKPEPLFWDSFSLAGDDILKNIVHAIVIDGPIKHVSNLGSIHSALENRMLEMTDDELSKLPSVKNPVYRAKMDNILRSEGRTKEQQIKSYASNLIHDFFGYDSNMMNATNRRCRKDFNTQVSVPIALKMMDLLRLNRPSKVYTYKELFVKNEPATYLLEHFYNHFGFRFTDLEWRFEPNAIADIVRTALEPLMKQLSILAYTYHCDVLILAGRPTSLDTITELFIKYYPTSPNRLIRLNEYMVGSWYPFADGQGYFYDQKSVVAVGAMIGYLSETVGFNGMALDFSKMAKKMVPTADYLGLYDARKQQINTSLMSPIKSTARITATAFPTFIGCKQLDVPIYQARPLYAIYNSSGKNSLRISLSRVYSADKEFLEIESVTDNLGEDVPVSQIELVQTSLADEGGYWLDKGEFELSIV